MISAAATGAAIGMAAGAITGAVTAAVQSAPTDYAGIAMIIAACGSLIGTIGGLAIALRRRSSASETLELMRQMRELEQHDGGVPDVSP